MKKYLLMLAVALVSLAAKAQDNNIAAPTVSPDSTTVRSQKIIMMSNKPTATKVTSLLGDIAFNQTFPYNSCCPMLDGKHCYTGCTVTAVTQIMKYYNYPQHPTIPANENGKIDYVTDKCKVHVKWNLAKTRYDWTQILPSYKKPAAATKKQQKAVGELLASVGATIHAQYEQTGTHSDTKRNYFIDYFGFDRDGYRIHSSLSTVERRCLEVKNSIDAGEIVCISSAEGHYFLIDGYDMTGEHPKFHVNWGWGGQDNGFYDIKDLKPSEHGGRDHKNYSGYYTLYMHTVPENNADDGLAIAVSDVTVDNAAVKPGDVVNVTMLGIVNESKVRNLTEPEYIYFVDTNSNKLFKADIFTTPNALQPVKFPGNGQSIKNVTKSVTIPATIPPGRYYIELRRTAKDHFFAKRQAMITVR